MIYIHVPFCRSFCTYCDFYSELATKCRGKEERSHQEILFQEYAAAIRSEMSAHKGEATDDVNTLYIGGGTPSVLPLSIFEGWVSSLKEMGYSVDFKEFTVEVNPEDIVERGQGFIEGLMSLGVNRISMGVQSFDDAILKWMNRRHDSATARKAYGIIEEAGIKNISIDLIFGLPQLSDSQWVETLEKALEISRKGIVPQHISSYQLSVEQGSALAAMLSSGKWEEATEEKCLKQYEILCDFLSSAGYGHYEISNFAQPGFEAIHNSAYWSHEPYLGLGPGAHSFVVESNGILVRRWNRPDLESYLKDFSSVMEYEQLYSEHLVIEKIMLGLRTSRGLSEEYLRNHCSLKKLSHNIDSGNLERIGNGNVRIPERCFFVSDGIIADLI